MKTEDKRQVYNMWVLLVGSSLSTLGVFISIPLISLYGVDEFKLSIAEIGVLSSIWPGTVFVLSFFCGMMADRIGYLTSVRTGLSINVIAFLVMALSPNIACFATGLFLFGVGKSFFDSSIRASMTCLCAPEDREKYFRIRYLMQNAACVLGPLVGVVAYKFLHGYAFACTMFLYLAFLTLTYVLLEKRHFKITSSGQDGAGFLRRFDVLRDFRLILWMASGTCILMAFGAYEAFMPVISAKANGLRPAFGILVSLNAATVVVFQLFYMRFLKSMSLRLSIMVGSALMATGFFLFAVEWHAYVMTIFATVVFSAGESVLFPCFEVIMDRIAPKEKKAMYFGAGELKQVGFFLGPLLGGFLYERTGVAPLFFACTFCILIASILLDQVMKITIKALPTEFKTPALG